MSAVSYVQFDGVEVVNINRTLAYLRTLADSRFSIASLGTCECDAIGSGYIAPATDPAPWYESGVSESGDFLGLILDSIELGSPTARSVTPTAPFGATIGRQSPAARVVGFAGFMYGASEAGIRYGEAWLTNTLAGSFSGCATADLRLLPACPESDQTARFRTLVRAGLVVGPTFGRIENVPRCRIQRVDWQMAAGNPWLRGDAEVCLDDESLVGGS